MINMDLDSDERENQGSLIILGLLILLAILILDWLGISILELI
jgi:hypothetical protein